MGTICRHCGMESDTERVCSWCSKSLAEDKQAAPVASQAGAPPAQGPALEARVPAPADAKLTESPRPVWHYFAAAGGVAVIVLLVMQYVSFKAAIAPPPTPPGWDAVKSKTGHFTLQSPQGWKFITAGSSGSYESVLVRRGPVYKISVDASGTKGALSDVSGAVARVSDTGEGGPPPLEKKPEGRFHETMGGLAQKKDPSYQEEGDMQPCLFAGQPAAYSVYSAKRRVGLFSITVKGWRLSCPGTDFGYEVRAEAPQEHWAEFEPIATQLIGSMQFGGK